jgi:PAS domain S-box-containing protein
MDVRQELASSALADLLFEEPGVGRCLVAPDGSVLRANLEWLRATGFSLNDALGADIIDLFPEARDVALARVRAGHRVDVPPHAQRIDGRDTWWEGSIAPVPMEHGTGLLLTAREIARDGPFHGRAPAPGDERAAPPSPWQRELAAAERLHALSTQLIQADDIQALYERILDTAVAIMRADFASIQMLDEARGELLLLGHRGFNPDAAKFWKWVRPASRSTCGVALRTGKRAVAPDVERCEWMAGSDDLETYLQTGIHAVQTTPLLSRSGAVIGMISTHWREPHDPSPEDLRMMDLLARQAADLIDRQRVQDALRESEARFRTVIENSRDGIHLLDVASGRYVFMSPAEVALTGFGADELREMTREAACERIHPDDRELPIQQQRDIIAGVRPHGTIEYRWKVKSGEYRWFSDSRSAVRDSRGVVVSLVGVTRDITDRKRAELAEHEREERYRTLFESIDQGFCIVEVLFDGAVPVDYRFLEVNPVFEQQTGIARAVGRRMREIAPGHEEHWFQIYGRVAMTGEPVRFENPARALGRFYEVYAFRVGSPEQRRVAILFSDITERRRATEQLLEADRRKTEFLAVLSHELRTPLAPIRNSIYLLEHGAAASEPAMRARQVIRRQTEHLTRLVDDLLDVTRISRGKIHLRQDLLDLREIVRQTANDQRSLFEQEHVALRVELGAGPVWVRADEVRIAQVVSNLLQNAVKFTPTGGVVTVSVNGSATAEIVVRDSGAGMEPDEIERMWEPFAQADRSLARTQGGLGLGLPLVKGLVELHGGTVRARSEGRGRGAEFHVTLPLAAEGTVPAEKPGAGVIGSRQVLVIEDNVDAGQSLADILELRGHHVRVARDGRSGLELAHELRPDVVFCDIGLPDVDGFDVARAMRRDDCFRSTRIIALTGYAQAQDRQRAREAGFDAHVAKPADLDELMKAMVGQA